MAMYLSKKKRKRKDMFLINEKVNVVHLSSQYKEKKYCVAKKREKEKNKEK